MSLLNVQTIQLQSQASHKEDAIRQVGQLLVKAGYIDAAYIKSMLGRESQANTYLGNGIAIPHGKLDDRHLILQTGIAVLQLPDGVEWNSGEVVHLVVGIAARSDEHLSILANLTDVLDNAEIAQQLAHTKDPFDIVTHLSRSRDTTSATDTPLPAEWADALSVDVTIKNSTGLHARPATFFVDVASQFASDICIVYNGQIANGKALASLLKLGVEGDESIRLLARGVDADAALQALQEAVEQELGEAHEQPTQVIGAVWNPVSDLFSLMGVAAAPGLAIGILHQFQSQHIVVSDDPKDSKTEHDGLLQALNMAHTQLDDIYESVKAESGSGEAAIFRAHQALLNDPDLLEQVKGLIDDGHSAAWSWQQAITERIAALQQIDDERLAARSADLNDIGQRVLRLLTVEGYQAFNLPDTPVILVAHDLLPSDTAQLDPQRILGLCMVAGGTTSHTAIIARSLGIPCVVGVGATLLEQPNDVMCILDGSAGHLYVHPDQANLDSAREFQEVLEQQRNIEYQDRYQPALMTDGYRVEVVANATKASEAAQAVEAGAEGIGLMRTEFLFLERDAPPSEEEQFEVYRAMVQALNGLPLIIRTLDIGGDKAVPYLALPAEDNPFLGERGIRLCLRRPDLFRTQLRAIYRARLTGPVKMMFPMVATLEELRAAKEIAEEVQREVGAPSVEMGIMVEIPSVVMLAREFAQEVDFFSIGTNDLAQYTLAMDRMHPGLARQVDALHPAVLRLIDRTVGAAYEAGKWVGVCGGIAGDPRGAVILAGLGVTELSISIPSIAAIKACLREVSFPQAQAIAQKALACTTATEVHALPLIS